MIFATGRLRRILSSAVGGHHDEGLAPRDRQRGSVRRTPLVGGLMPPNAAPLVVVVAALSCSTAYVCLWAPLAALPDPRSRYPSDTATGLCQVADSTSRRRARHHPRMTIDPQLRRLLKLGTIASLLALLLCPIAISMGYRPPAGEERPKVTDWMQAWGGFFSTLFAGGAFAAAATAIYIERKRRHEDVRRLDEQRAEDLARMEADQADRDMAQARLIMTTCEFDERTMQITSMTVVNHSQHAILDVELWIGLQSEGGSPNKTRWREVVPALLPGNGFELSNPPQRFVLSPESADLYVPWVEFVDARGLRWRRYNIMRPIRVFDAARDAVEK